MDRMKACVLEDYGKVCIKDVPFRPPEEGQALVKVRSVGICGSDTKAFQKKGSPVSVPLVLGHEVAGVIVELKPNGPCDLKEGDRVLLKPYIYCGVCYPCSLGRPNCCESLGVLGVQIGGAMSEYFSHPIKSLVKLSDELEWHIAPLAEPLAISLHALHRVNLCAGENALIIGAGPIGLMAAIVARHYGALPILVDIVPARLRLAESLGILNTINPGQCDPFAETAKITRGRMAEVVVEASGSERAIRQTLDYASYCGRVSLTGWPTGETSLPTAVITRKELQIYGSRNSANEFEEAIELIENNVIDAETIISEVVSFGDLPRMIELISEFPDRYIKVNALLPD